MSLSKTGICCLLLLSCACMATAQNHQATRLGSSTTSEVFADLPNRMPVNRQTFSLLLSKSVGDKVVFPVAAGFTFNGVVVSKSILANGRSQTVVLKATDRIGVAFTVTALIASDGATHYNGRLLSAQHRDAFVIDDKGNQPALQKTGASDLVIE